MTWHCVHKPAYDCRSGFNPCKCLVDEVQKRHGAKMNVQEFSKLKTGDKVHNGLTNSAGRVTKTDQGGVFVAWGNSADDQARYFSVQGTAWFHWSIPEPDAIEAGRTS